MAFVTAVVTVATWLGIGHSQTIHRMRGGDSLRRIIKWMLFAAGCSAVLSFVTTRVALERMFPPLLLASVGIAVASEIGRYLLRNSHLAAFVFGCTGGGVIGASLGASNSGIAVAMIYSVIGGMLIGFTEPPANSA